MKLLITRPDLDARALSARLEEAGFETLVSPLMEIIPAQSAPEIGDVDALIFTSANAIDALAIWLEEGSPCLDKPVYVVGEKTEAAARKAGFTTCHVADGSVDDLIALVSKSPHEGERWAYISGDPIKRDLDAPLDALGIKLSRHIVYEARAIDSFTEEVKDALISKEIDVVLFYSPRSVTLFTAALEKAGLNSAVEDLRALCLSETIGDEARQQGFHEIWVAHEPNTDAVIEGLKKASEGTPDMDLEPTTKTKPPLVKYLPWALLFIALIFIAGIFSASKIPFLAPEPPAPVEVPASTGLTDAISTLVKRINDLQQRLDGLENAPQGTDEALAARIETLESVQPAQVDLTPVLNRLNSLEQRLSSYEAALAEGNDDINFIPQSPDPELMARLDALEDRLTQMPAQTGSDVSALRLLSFASLKDQIATGAVYDNSLEGLGSYIRESTPAYQTLKTYATTGVQTDAALKQDFSLISGDILLAAKTPEDAGWWDRFLARTQTVVTVRKTGDVDGDTPEARLSRLETRVENGDWAGALSALNEFPAHVRDADPVKAWAEAVTAKTEVEGALAALARRFNAAEAQ